MKKFLSFLIGAALAIAIVPMTNAEATSAQDGCGTDQVKLVVHYQKYDGGYEGAAFYGWSWINGIGANGLFVFDTNNTDDFGVYREVCLDKTTSHADGTQAASMAFFEYGADLNDGKDYNPGDLSAWSTINLSRVHSVDSNGKRADGTTDANISFNAEAYAAAWETGEVHLYYYSGTETIGVADGTSASQEAAKKVALPYLKDNLGVTKVVYYSKTEDYFAEDNSEAWEIWTWSTGTNGSQVGDNGGVQFVDSMKATCNGATITVRIAYIYTDTDAENSIGFIVRSFGGWASKKYDDDILIDVTGVKGSGVQEVYYLAGDAETTTGDGAGVEFMNKSTEFAISSAEFISSTSVTFVINKELAPAALKELTMTNVAVLKDTDGNAVTAESVRYDDTANVTKLTIVLANDIDKTKDYVVTFNAVIGGNTLSAELAAEMDKTAPVITAGTNNVVTVKAGAKTVSFIYTAVDNATDDYAGDDLTGRVYVKEGVVDLTKPGDYNVTLVCADDMGNTAEQVVTVRVTDNCATTSTSSYLLFALLPLTVVGGLVAIKKFAM